MRTTRPFAGCNVHISMKIVIIVFSRISTSCSVSPHSMCIHTVAFHQTSCQHYCFPQAVRYLKHNSLPEPVFLPQENHLFNGNTFSLRQEEEDKDGHDCNPAREEEKNPKLESTQKGEEGLAYYESEEEIDCHCYALPC